MRSDPLPKMTFIKCFKSAWIPLFHPSTISSPVLVISYNLFLIICLLFNIYIFSPPTLNFLFSSWPPSSRFLLGFFGKGQLMIGSSVCSDFWWVLSWKSAAHLCNCNEGHERRQQGSQTLFFLLSFSSHTPEENTVSFFLSTPSPIIAVFCYPNLILPGEAARERDWSGTKHILHLHVARALVCFLLFFTKVGHFHCSLQHKTL